MKFLIVEDDRSKRLFLELFFKEKGAETTSFQSVQPAIKYAIEHASEIHGIILDLGLSSYDYSDDDFSFTRGLDLVNELTQKRIRIPILINSSTYINISELKESNSNVVSQMNDDDWELRQFFNKLKEEK